MPSKSSKPSKSDRDRAKRLTPKGPNQQLSKAARVRPRAPAGDDPRPWTSSVIDLPVNHGWRGKAGHKIFIADRGAFRVDYPQHFHVVPQEDKSIALMDAATSERCSVRLKVTVFHLPAMDYTGLPLDGLIRDCVLKDDPEAYRQITGSDPENRARYDPADLRGEARRPGVRLGAGHLARRRHRPPDHDAQLVRPAGTSCGRRRCCAPTTSTPTGRATSRIFG